MIACRREGLGMTTSGLKMKLCRVCKAVVKSHQLKVFVQTDTVPVNAFLTMRNHSCDCLMSLRADHKFVETVKIAKISENINRPHIC